MIVICYNRYKKVMRMDIREQLIRYEPINEQEQQDRMVILQALSMPDVFTRNNSLAHMSASGWIVNPSHDRILMCYHSIYQSWSWLGGHADGNEDLLAVAVQEAKEESGLPAVRVLDDQPLTVEILTVDGHWKRGVYVPSHLHLNVTYALEADDTLPLHIKADENSRLAWFPIDEAPERSSEPWMKEHIYQKCNASLRRRKLIR